MTLCIICLEGHSVLLQSVLCFRNTSPCATKQRFHAVTQSNEGHLRDGHSWRAVGSGVCHESLTLRKQMTAISGQDKAFGCQFLQSVWKALGLLEEETVGVPPECWEQCLRLQGAWTWKVGAWLPCNCLLLTGWTTCKLQSTFLVFAAVSWWVMYWQCCFWWSGVSFCYPFSVSFCDNFLPMSRIAFPTFVCILSLLLHLCCIVSYCILSCPLRNSVGFRKAAVPNPASSPQLCPGKPPALTMRHRSAFLPIQPLASLVRWLRWMLTVIMVLTFAHQELERDHNFMSYRSPVTIKR